MLGKSPIKWRQRSDMTTAVDWDVNNQFKKTTTEKLYMHIGRNGILYNVSVN